jgi:hypothetical protein
LGANWNSFESIIVGLETINVQKNFIDFDLTLPRRGQRFIAKDTHKTTLFAPAGQT